MFLAQRLIVEAPKKDFSTPLGAYNPSEVEEGHYDWWVTKGYFHANAETDKEKYVICIPPPNVTGILHLGHSLFCMAQDALIRWNRMRGKECIWAPGIDHAGIATQVVVEKLLAQRDPPVSRHDLGREPFIEEIWKWVREKGSHILEQFKRMGCSLDWHRSTFTFDEERCRAVTECFVRFFDEGILYRSNRLVNWDCTLRSAVSEIEVNYIDVDKPTKLRVPGHARPVEFGVLTHFCYKVVDAEGAETGAELEVATTRLETMLGDTAVAVHPEDTRYTQYHGLRVKHPFNGRLIPIVTDAELVDMEFGTGAVKITPAHDPNDFEVGKRHNLEFINILKPDGRMNDKCGRFEGMLRFEARYHVGKALEELGLLRGTTPNKMRIGLCSRTNDVIEPKLVPQWYVNCQEMGATASDLVRNGTIEIEPACHRDTWFRWMDNIRDWCISRQLWWGHRVPAYTVRIEGEPEPSPEDLEKTWVVGRTEEEARQRAAEKHGVPAEKIILEQDPDVLDTWFSSGIYPLTIFGWPEETADLRAFYPTSDMETGHDILFFWVARMVMMCHHLTGVPPFKRILLHAMVRDSHGNKMSKSRGNVIDPIHVMEGRALDLLLSDLDANTQIAPQERTRARNAIKKDYPQGIPQCGVDGLRFTLAAYTTQGRDINLDIKRMYAYRAFCNKLWNTVKFALPYMSDGFAPMDINEVVSTLPLAPLDRWMLSRRSFAAQSLNACMARFDLAGASTAIFNFFKYELCKRYIEAIKPVLYDRENAAGPRRTAVLNVLHHCIDSGLRMMHIFAPFVTEELWQRLPRHADDPESIVIARFPEEVSAWACAELEAEFVTVFKAVKAGRHLLKSCNLPKAALQSLRPTFYLHARDGALAEILTRHMETLLILAQCERFEVLREAPAEELTDECALQVFNEHADLYIMLRGLIDPAAEIARLRKDQGKQEKMLENYVKKTEKPGYEAKVPQRVRDKDAQNIASQRAKVDTILGEIAKFERMLARTQQ